MAAYAALMTDDYPPFRFDTGGADPAGPSAVTVPLECQRQLADHQSIAAAEGR